MRSCLFSLLLIGLFSSSISAQPPGRRGGGGFDFRNNPKLSEMMLLRSDQVQSELKISEEQQARLDEISNATREKARETFRGMRDLPPEERRAAFEAARGKMEQMLDDVYDEVGTVLTDDQKKRLSQVSVQIRGPRAVAGDAMAKQLKLTESQREKLSEIMEKQREETSAVFSDIRSGEIEREAAREIMEGLQKEMEEKVADVLTQDQTKAWREMQGDPIEFDRASLFRRGGDRRRGGERGGDERRGRPDRNNQE